MLKFNSAGFGWQKTPLFTNITLSCGPGDLIWLSGENGAGKSTLLKMASGLIPHFNRGVFYEGEVQVLGQDIKIHPPKHLYPHLFYIPSRNLDLYFLGETLEEELSLSRAMAGPETLAFDERLSVLNKFTQFVRSDRRRPLKQLPASEQRLLLMFMGLCQGARLVLLDEVFRQAAGEHIALWTEMLSWLAEQGGAAVMAAHSSPPLYNRRWHMADGGCHVTG